MKKTLALALIVAVGAAGCAQWRDARTRLSTGANLGSPAVLINTVQIAGRPALTVVIDQEPLYLAGRTTVTWTLPDDGATYKDFRLRIDRQIKSVSVGVGGALVMTPLQDPRVVQREFTACRPLSARSFECPLPRLDPGFLYSYTISFTRNGERIEVDPSMMP